MSKEDLAVELENIITKYKGQHDSKYAIVVVEAIQTLALLRGWVKDKPKSTSGIGGTW